MKLLQRIFNYDEIQDNHLTPDKVLKSFMQGSPVYIITYTSYIL